MKYTPVIKSAKPKQEFPVGKHRAVLFGDIVSAGPVEYLYIMGVFDDNGQPCYFVASEANSSITQFGGGSHFLGLFPGEIYANCCDSGEWAAQGNFTPRTLSI